MPKPDPRLSSHKIRRRITELKRELNLAECAANDALAGVAFDEDPNVTCQIDRCLIAELEWVLSNNA